MNTLILRIEILILYFVLSNKATAEERKCYSRFDYDKKMIEEMIRAEIKLEEFAKRMDLNDAALGDVKTDFRNEIQSAKEEVAMDLNDFIQKYVANTTDGWWSDWTSWSTCSATCGVGMVTRSRSCDNPPPVKFGRQCVGNDQEWKTCESKKCQGDGAKIAFSAKLSSEIIQTSAGQTIVFDAITVNHGNGYSSFTGNFTTPVGGTYQFSFGLLFNAQASGDKNCGFDLMKGSTGVVSAWSDTHSGKNGHSQANLYYIIDLMKDENVYVTSDRDGCYIYGYRYTFFSGVLLF